MTTPGVRIAIVEDHPVVREGTAAILAAQPGIVVVGTAGSLTEARALLARVEVDVVLLDIRLGAESGLGLLTATDRTSTDRPAADARPANRPAIVVLTAYDYPQYADAALRMGAAGFVLKTAPLEEIVAAIRLAAEGGLALRWESAPARSRPTCAGSSSASPSRPAPSWRPGRCAKDGSRSRRPDGRRAPARRAHGRARARRRR
jgi:DNA-binding NarL/FixJ family response regulator